MSLLAVLGVCVVLAGCAGGQSLGGGEGAEEAVRVDCNPIVARIDGQAVYRDELVSVLMRGYGGDVLDKVVALRLVRKHAGDSGIGATVEMIDEELSNVLNDMAPGKTRKEQIGLLDYVLRSRGMSMAEFSLIIETQALLRRLVSQDVEITDEMLRNEYADTHGRGVQVRQIVASSLRRIELVDRRLTEGAEFTELVEMFSEDQRSLATDGLVGPFSRVDESVAREIREAAHSLEQVGQRSDIIAYRDSQNEQYWAIVELVRVVSADSRTLEEVADELAGTLQRRAIAERMQQLQAELRNGAQIEIVDVTLQGQVSR